MAGYIRRKHPRTILGGDQQKDNRTDNRNTIVFALLLVVTIVAAVFGLGFGSGPDAGLNDDHHSQSQPLEIPSFQIGDNDARPIGNTLNGSYVGVLNHGYTQDLFLGIPYAQVPVNELRFVAPKPLNSTWKELKNATSYGPQCNGYNSVEIADPQSEDCLSLNIIRPHVQSLYSEPLPVVCWIYGGANDHGSASDARFNLSHIVNQSVAIGKPIVAVSFNYRASIFGFMSGGQIVGEGNTNVGLHDQRFALRWIQENIAGFGGDPRKVTIWGASSGADSIGLHLLAHAGRDDGLFRAAIMQSGGPVVSSFRPLHPSAQDAFEKITQLTDCHNSTNPFECLQQVPFAQLNPIFNNSEAFNSSYMRAFASPVVDGDMFQGFGSRQLALDKFVKVPIINGFTTDEGGGYAPWGLSSAAELRHYMVERRGLPPVVVDKLVELYDTHPASLSAVNRNASKELGSYFPVVSAILGDMEITAAHRLTCDVFSGHVDTYCYRFDAMPSGMDPRLGVVHAADLGPTFHNTACTGFPRCPFEGKSESYFALTDRITRMWIGFIHDLNPNSALSPHSDTVRWTKYDRANPQIYLFDDKQSNGMENGDLRKDAIEYIQHILGPVLGK